VRSKSNGDSFFLSVLGAPKAAAKTLVATQAPDFSLMFCCCFFVEYNTTPKEKKKMDVVVYVSSKSRIVFP
jgi:hypothetical protein